MDRVEVLEPTSDGTFGGLCPNGLVYNLEVEGTHTYIAEGVIVHNCHLAGVQNRRNITVVGVKRLSVVAHRVVMASGSPMWNMPSGLWPLVDIACPAAFGDFWPYAIRHADAKPGAHGWSSDGSSNERELELRLSAIMLRRTWRDIQADLPPINRSIEYVELSDADHAAIFTVANELRRAVDAGKPQTVVGNLERLRKLYAKRKVARAVELAGEAIAVGHSVIVWSWHREVAASAVEALRKLIGDARVFGPIHGQMPPKRREELLDAARAAQGPRVIAATMGSLSTGVSLNWADVAIKIELDWTPAVHQQAEMRPFDGTRPISTVYLVADCDPDRRQADALVTKLEAGNALNLKSGTGDAVEILSKAFQIGPGRTLDAVADLILQAETI